MPPSLPVFNLSYYLYLPNPEEKSYHPLRHLLYLTVWKPYLEDHPNWKLTTPDRCDLSNRDPIRQTTEFPYFSGSGKIFHHIRIFPMTWLTDKVPCARLCKMNQSPFNYKTRAQFYPPTFIFDPKNPSLILKQYRSHVSYNKNQIQKNQNHTPLWYYKPSRGGGTRGIKLSHSFETLVFHAKLHQKQAVIQQEIEQPDLIQGRKYEIRWYLVVVYYRGELSYWWFNEGYLVISPQKYSTTSVDTKSHFTNRNTSSDSERKSKIYQMTLSEAIPIVKEDLNKRGLELITQLCQRIPTLKSSILSNHINSNPPEVYLDKPQYEVLAIDAIWSRVNQKLSLVEVNRYPGLYLSRDTPSCRELKIQFYQSIMSQIIEPILTNQPLDSSKNLPKKLTKVLSNLK